MMLKSECKPFLSYLEKTSGGGGGLENIPGEVKHPLPSQLVCPIDNSTQ